MFLTLCFQEEYSPFLQLYAENGSNSLQLAPDCIIYITYCFGGKFLYRDKTPEIDLELNPTFM